MTEADADITELLNLAVGGDHDANDRVFRRLYGELRRIASAHRRKLPPQETLSTTALVNEAYLRLIGRSSSNWNGRAHFFFTASRAMRDILVEDARRRLSLKRGGDQRRVELGETSGPLTDASPETVLDLDRALSKLEAEIPEHFQLVMLRHFSGLSMPETAEVLDTPLRSLERHWRFCRAWLRRELREDAGG